jgi:alanine dehydrogenase
MLVGVPKEIKDNEYRVGLVPASVRELTARGHRVLLEPGAGDDAGFPNADYAAAGAEIAVGAADIFDRAELIVKVKEPLVVERKRLRRGQILFAYLHLAPDRAQTEELAASGISAVAYETVTAADGTLPLLTPMSEVAGRMAPQIGAHYLERPHGGRGVLLGGVPGVPPASVLIIGAGVAGSNAALVASGMAAKVTVAARSQSSLQRVAKQFGTRVATAVSTPETLDALCRQSDLVIAAALVPGAAAPKLIAAATVSAMKAGSVIVDISIDQGGCAETSRPTSHSQPTYVVNGVVHYCVTNMPGAVPRTSTLALNRATLPFVLALADKGLHGALADDPGLRDGLNIHDGKITCRPVAEALKFPYIDAATALGT